MCGINLLMYSNNRPVAKELIIRMNKALNHRGPDEQDYFLHQNCALGHTRLSIVDIKNGHQPMVSGDERYIIVFNGEIYNYLSLKSALEAKGFIFQTSSDTEVVLAVMSVHGKTGLTMLQGMFSFVLYDKLKKTTLLARDRLGIKPLYYHHGSHALIASSEIKSIFASGEITPKLNRESIRNHFNYQFSISPYTAFEDVFELPPGHFMECTDNLKLTIKKYWDLEFPHANEYETDDVNYWQNQFEESLHEAAISHLIGEVPVGTYLSGGLDSSTMAFLLKQHYPKDVHSFSIHFTNPANDESFAYRAVAEHLGIYNSELTMEDNRAGGYFGLLNDCIYHLEQPQRMAVDIPHFLLSRHVRNENYKVVYTGDGADEILAGYDCFRQDFMRVKGNSLMDEKAREKLYLSEFTQYFSDDYMQMLLQLHHPDTQQQTINQYNCYPAWYDFWQILNNKTDDLFVGAEFSDKSSQMAQLVEQLKPSLDNRDPVNQSLYIETKTRLPGWILWKSDRLSMAHSVEARVPFLDHRLVELCAAIPPNLKLKEMDEKHILKNTVSAYLPKIQGEYKKRGFYTPIKEWFFTPEHRDQLNHYFAPQKLEESGIFNPKTVQSHLDTLVKMPQPDSLNSYYRTFQLEWTLMLVLTTQMLHQNFVAKEAPCFHDI